MRRNDLLTRKPRRITARFLKRQGACESGIDEFAKVFPKGADITAKNWLKADLGGLDFDWFISKLPADRQRAIHELWGADSDVWTKDETATVREFRSNKINKTEYNKRAKRRNAKLDRDNAESFMKIWKSLKLKPRKGKKRG